MYKYPYGDSQQLNLDWIISKIKELKAAGLGLDLKEVSNALISLTYNTSTAYRRYDYAFRNGKLYRCLTDTTGAFDPAAWQEALIGDDLSVLTRWINAIDAAAVVDVRFDTSGTNGKLQQKYHDEYHDVVEVDYTPVQNSKRPLSSNAGYELNGAINTIIANYSSYTQNAGNTGFYDFITIQNLKAGKYKLKYTQATTMTSNTRNTAWYWDNNQRNFQSTATNRNLTAGDYEWEITIENDGYHSFGVWVNNPDVNVTILNFELIALTNQEIYDNLNGAINSNESAIAIVSDNNTHATLTKGQYVYIKNHGTLTEGLYQATMTIPQNNALSNSNVVAVSGGGLNALRFDTITQSALGNINKSGEFTAQSVTLVQGTYFVFTRVLAATSGVVELKANGGLFLKTNVTANIFNYSFEIFPNFSDITITSTANTTATVLQIAMWYLPIKLI